MMKHHQHRFDDKVDRAGIEMPGMAGPCWHWTGAVDRAGYPKFWFEGNAITAQRAAYILRGERPAPGKLVVAFCGNRLCVRPNHLALANPKEAQALACRGRHSVGVGDVWLARKLVRDGEATPQLIAEAWGFSMAFVEQFVGDDAGQD